MYSCAVYLKSFGGLKGGSSEPRTPPAYGPVLYTYICLLYTYIFAYISKFAKPAGAFMKRDGIGQTCMVHAFTAAESTEVTDCT